MTKKPAAEATTRKKDKRGASGVPEQWTVNALATELQMDRTVLSKKLIGLEPAKQSGRTRWFYMADVVKHIYAGGVVNSQHEQALLAKARRERMEHDNKVAMGEYVALDDVKKEWADYIIACKAKLLSIPSKAIMPVLAADNPGQARRILTNHIKEALMELAEDTEEKAL